MKSSAKTVEEYLSSLPTERRDAIQVVRRVILDNLPQGYRESLNWGMISYEIPLETYPNTYNKQPLQYAALASQKNYMSLYLMNTYWDKAIERWFIEKYRASGKKLNMGKSCVRFKKLTDLPLDLIAATIARTSVDEFIRHYEILQPLKKK
jgi:hypothetical protein